MLSDPESGVGSALGGRKMLLVSYARFRGVPRPPRSAGTDWFPTRDLGASSDPESGLGSVLSCRETEYLADAVLLVIPRTGSGAMPALRSRRNGPRLRDVGTRHPMPKHGSTAWPRNGLQAAGMYSGVF